MRIALDFPVFSGIFISENFEVLLEKAIDICINIPNPNKDEHIRYS